MKVKVDFLSLFFGELEVEMSSMQAKASTPNCCIQYPNQSCKLKGEFRVNYSSQNYFIKFNFFRFFKFVGDDGLKHQSFRVKDNYYFYGLIVVRYNLFWK